MSKRIEDFEVIENKKLTNDFCVIELSGSLKLPELKPGQFAQVRVDGSSETFLRRPISIHDVDYESNTIKLLVQIAGKGTETLSNLKKGEILNLVYPLGNSFSMPSENEKIALVGGGCGVAPLLYLARYFRTNGHKPDIILGFRNSERVIEYGEYSKFGNVFITTEDGSRGEKGFIINHSIFSTASYDKIYCCGPERMMKAVAAYCKVNNIACEVSLENLMACGIGVCLCCIVNTVKGNVCSCTDGPIFNINDLRW